MKKKNAQFNKKTATVALIFMLATIMWLTCLLYTSDAADE